jgi:hypothetical protein
MTYLLIRTHSPNYDFAPAFFVMELSAIETVYEHYEDVKPLFEQNATSIEFFGRLGRFLKYNEELERALENADAALGQGLRIDSPYAGIVELDDLDDFKRDSNDTFRLRVYNDAFSFSAYHDTYSFETRDIYFTELSEMLKKHGLAARGVDVS